jgi:hypothetical protein
MKTTVTFRVVWHDAGCIVLCSDGSRLPFKGRRYSQADISSAGTKRAIASLPGAVWKRFEK